MGKRNAAEAISATPWFCESSLGNTTSSLSSSPDEITHPGWGGGLGLTQLSCSQVGSRFNVQGSSGKFSKVDGTSCLPAYQPMSGGGCWALTGQEWVRKTAGPPPHPAFTLGLPRML